MRKPVRGALVVAVSKDGLRRPVWEASWRDSRGTTIKRRVGLAQLEPVTDGEGLGRGWQRRWAEPRTKAGSVRRPPAGSGLLTAQAATVRMAELQQEHEEALVAADREAAREAVLAAQGVLTLADLSATWLAYARDVKGMRASTLEDYRIGLARLARDPHFCTADGEPKPIEEITAADVESFRDATLARGRSARTVNKLRQLLSNVLGYAAKSAKYPAVTVNPVLGVEKLAEPRRGRLNFYEPHEVEHVVRVLRTGQHRKPFSAAGATSRKPWAAAAREQENTQDAALVIVLAFAGLRLGEALALRWKDVNFRTSKLEVWRSYSAKVEGPTKGGHERAIPMVPQVATALAQLGQREHLTGPGDRVFLGDGGGYVDDSAFRRRFKAACVTAELRPLRVHDLRHGFASMVARAGYGAHEVQAMAGHTDVRTTARYMHAKPSPQDAERLAAVFAADYPAGEIRDPPAPALGAGR